MPNGYNLSPIRNKLTPEVSRRLKEINAPEEWVDAVLGWNNDIMVDFWSGRAILFVHDDPNHQCPIHFKMTYA